MGDIHSQHKQNTRMRHIMYVMVFLFGIWVICFYAFLLQFQIILPILGTIMVLFGLWKPQWLLGMLLLLIPFTPFLDYLSPQTDVLLLATVSVTLIISVLFRYFAGVIDWKWGSADIFLSCALLALIAVQLMYPTNDTLPIISLVLILITVKQVEITKKWERVVMRGLFCIAVLQIAIGFIQLMPFINSGTALMNETAPFLWNASIRPSGTFLHYIPFSLFLGWFCLTGLYSLEKTKSFSGAWNAALAILIVIAMTEMLFTYTSPVWLGYVLGISSLFLLRHLSLSKYEILSIILMISFIPLLIFGDGHFVLFLFIYPVYTLGMAVKH